MSSQPKPRKISLPELPWKQDALEPVISKKTIDYHYGKHHQAYVDKTNGAVEGTRLAGMALEELIRTAAGDEELGGVFNNAAQVWNHSFYWNSLTPETKQPSKQLEKQITQDFGGLENFGTKFADAATGQFGSGWAWLVFRDGRLEIETTGNADTPIARDVPCLLTLDVWEHAYYLDYQNDRGAYVKAVIDRCLNWDHASRQFAAATAA